MFKLLEVAKTNSTLRYLDAKSGEIHKLNELIENVSIKTFNKPLCFLYVDNSISSVASFWSFYSIESVIVLLNKQLNQTLKDSLESTYIPDIIIDDARQNIENYELKKYTHFSSFIKNGLSIHENIDSSLKLLLSTSGTTGSSKFVKLSDENLFQNASSIIDYLPINDKDVCPLNLNFSYSYGLSVLTTNSIAGGTIVCNIDDVLSKSFWEDFDRYQFTSIAGVPYIYEMLNRIGFLQKTYKSLRYFTQAGGKLNDVLLDLLTQYSKEKEVLFYVMYGQTEATARMSFLNPNMLLSKKGSIGKPIKNGQFNIDEESGELLYQGPNVFGGYVNDINDFHNFEKNTLLKTGDIAKNDNEGYYYIVGRLKRMTKILGNRINLDELEKLLKNQFNKGIFACVGLNDRFVLVTLIGENNSVFEKEIKDFIKMRLNIHPSFVKIMYIPEMPLTANGKVNYTKILALYECL